MKNTLLVASALAAAISFVAVGTASAADSEQCFGVAQAGKNDCKAAGHDCKGHSTVSRAGTDFVLLPAGTCQKIVGGSLKPKA